MLTLCHAFKLSGFAKKIRYSGPLKERLEEECKREKVDFHVPERNVATRWNSTVIMMNSAFSLRTPIDNLCDRERDLGKFKLTELEWHIVTQLRPILGVSLTFHVFQFHAANSFHAHRGSWTRPLACRSPMYVSSQTYVPPFLLLHSALTADLTCIYYRLFQ